MDHCQACGAFAPTKHVTFMKNIGVLVMRFHSKMEGHLCRACIGKYFWEYFLVTLFLGWWGIISFVMTLVILPMNLIQFLGALSLPRQHPEGTQPSFNPTPIAYSPPPGANASLSPSRVEGAPATPWLAPGAPAPAPAASAPVPHYAAPTPDADSARTLGKWGLILSLIPCLGITTLIGGILSALSISRGRKSGIGAPGLAVAGLVVCGLWVVGTAAVLTVSAVASSRRDARIAALHQKVDQARLSESLSHETACALAELSHVEGLQSKAADAVTCPEPVRVSGARAELRSVTYDGRKPKTVCLARGHRWFVDLSLSPEESCGDAPVVGAWTDRSPKTEAEFKLEEGKVRGADQTRWDTAFMERFDAKLTAVADALDEEHDDHPCTALDGWKAKWGGLRPQLPTVDGDLLLAHLTGEQDQDPWTMFTRTDLRTALDDKQPLSSRANAARRAFEDSGPLLVVYEPLLKAWPKVYGDANNSYSSKDFKYSQGSFMGRFTLVDLNEGRIVCSKQLTFRNSNEIRLDKYESPKSGVERDFRRSFHDASDEVAKAMTEDKVGLAWDSY